jgi:hypothetical protein
MHEEALTDASHRAAVAGQVERSVRPVPARVYRVQDVEGRGPWRPGFSRLWVRDRDDHDNLRPWVEQFGVGIIPRNGWPFGRHFGCAWPHAGAVAPLVHGRGVCDAASLRLPGREH